MLPTALAAAAAPFEDVLVVVDSVSGFGGAELRPDAWGLDFLLTGSQKSFALPPGLSFGVASEKMMERAADAPRRGYYFDLTKYAGSQEKWQSPTTPAVSTLFALQVQLERMKAEIDRNVFDKCAESTFPLIPQRIVSDVRQTLPEDGILSLVKCGALEELGQ